ncbi:MAG TPA: hypothetical protein V6D29_21425 [Leptolyngbyaceae cyanobacterium]
MFEYLFPRRHLSTQDVLEILEIHQMAHDFQQEVADRERFAAYCEWYDQTAQKHQQEWIAMQQDIQPLKWFSRQ